MKKEWKGTKTEVFVIEFAGIFNIQDEDHYEGKNVLDAEDVDYDVAKLNANLFADALNTIQKCNKMPSELLDVLCAETTKNDLQAEKIIELKKHRDELLRLFEKVAYRQSLDDIKYYKELLNKINNGE